MSLYVCDKCGCEDNTALTRYWFREKGDPKLCSECDPQIGKWHGQFEKSPPAQARAARDDSTPAPKNPNETHD